MCKSSLVTQMVVVFALSLLLVTCLASSHPILAAVADDAQVQLNQGADLTGQSRHTDAIVEYQEVVTLYAEQGQTNPQVAGVVAEALNAKGDSQRQLGQFDEALATFSQVLSQYSQFRSACCESTLNTAKIYQARGDNVTALQWYARVLRDYSDKINRADFAIVRALTLLKKTENVPQSTREELDTAIAIYNQTKAEEDQIDTTIAAARAKAVSGSTTDARTDLLALAANPALDIAHRRLLKLGMAQLAAGDNISAQSSFDRLLAVAAQQTGPEDLRRMRMCVMYGLRNYEAAIAEGEEAVAIYRDGTCTHEMLCLLARAYQCSGRDADALRAYDDIISRYSSAQASHDVRTIVSIALVRSAQMLEKQGQSAEALARYQRVVTDYPEVNLAGSASASMRRLQRGGQQ